MIGKVGRSYVFETGGSDEEKVFLYFYSGLGRVR